MLDKFRRLLTVIALVLVAFLALGALAPAGQPVEAAENAKTVVYASVPYSATGYVQPTYATTWDYVNVHVKVVVTGSQVTTVTPQFSNVTGVNCSSVTDWYTATEYQIVESDASTDTLVTLSTPQRFTITGSGNEARHVRVTGRCVRVKLESAAAIYTPTVYLRLFN